jgi:RNA polymerase sigma-70 factor, ECF subfamily
MTLASPESSTDGLNLALLKAGDETEFARFVRLYQDMVFACGRSLGLRSHDTEDVASETFLAAYRYINTYDGKGKLSSWLWKIAYHKAVDHIASRRTDKAFAPDDMDFADSPGHETGLEAAERNQAVWDEVSKLPPAQAATVVLFYREGRSTREIAEILGNPENTIRTWLHRGRNELQNRLKAFSGNRI